MSDIHTVIFDLGGVYFTNGTSRLLEFLTKNYSLSEEIANEIVNGELGSEYRTGTITGEEFWQTALKRWDIDEDRELLAGTWQSSYKPITGTVDLVRRIGRAGYELLFLSDTVEERVYYLESLYSFQKDFRDGAFSYILGVRKPNPKIYEAVLEKASSPPEQCLFIDDKEKNLPPASSLGMKTLRFVNPEQLEADLKAIGLSV